MRKDIDLMEYSSDVNAQAAYVTNAGGSIPIAEYAIGSNNLLFHFNGTTGDKPNPETGQTATYVGTAAVSSVQKKFGTASLLLDGDSDYVTIPDAADWSFGTGDFTIDCWFRWVSLTGDQTLFCHQNTATTQQLFLDKRGDQLLFYAYNTSVDISVRSSDLVLVVDTLYHIAVVRYGNIFTIYLNGLSVASTTQAFTMPDGDNAFFIGNNDGGIQYFNGYIDEPRILKGTAAWTTNFNTILQSYSESTIKTQGSYSLKGIAAITTSLNKTLTRIINPELVTNGGFDTDVTGWDIQSPYGTISSTSGGVSGNCMKSERLNSNYVIAHQILTIVVGRTYKFEGYYKVVSGTAVELALGWNYGGTQYFDTGFITNTDWTLITTTFVATSTYLDIQLNSEMVGLANGVYNLFDSISIKEVEIDLSGLSQIKFDMRASRTGSNIKIGLHNANLSPSFCTNAGGTATADAYGDGYEPSKAFNGNTGDNWYINAGTMPHWLKYDLGSGITKIAIKLRLYTYHDGSNNWLKDFTLQGSNDDSDWTTIYTGQNANNATGWQDFTFTNTVAYRYYKINVISNWAGGIYTSIYEVEMMEYAITKITPNILSADTFQEVVIPLQNVINANKDAIDQIIITIVNADAANTIYLDNMFSYYIPQAIAIG